MTGKRTRYGADFKAKVALDAIRGELTTSQLATKHGVHQTMINDWKRMAIAGLASIFDGKLLRHRQFTDRPVSPVLQHPLPTERPCQRLYQRQV